MTDRGGPLTDAASACPFVAFEDERDERSDRPDPRHRCYADTPPAPRGRSQQATFCLTPSFAGCPVFLAWAGRQAARPAGSAAARGTPPPRELDDPPRPTRPVAPALPPFGHPAAPAPADDEAIEYDSDDLASLLGRAASRRGPVDEDADPTGLPGSVPDGPPRRTSTWDWSAPPPWTAGGRADRADPRDGSPRLTDDEQGRPGSRVEDPSRGLADLLSSDDDDFDAPDADDLGSLHEVPSGPVRAQPGRARSLSDMLGWDRRPRAGSPVRPPIVGQQPPWERPRRYEAYPSLRTRVGLSLPPRIVLGAVALVVTAVTLFFVPPLLLNQDPGGAPGRTREPGASTASLSPSADASPLPTATPVPTPGGRTYTVKSGDTLSKIAKKYGLTIEQVLAANKAIKDPNRIAIGDVIVIPSAAPSAIVDTGPTATP